jgi:hypothetical protein
LFDEFFYGDEEGDGFFSVDDSVVVGEGDVHHGADFDSSVAKGGLAWQF